MKFHYNCFSAKHIFKIKTRKRCVLFRCELIPCTDYLGRYFVKFNLVRILCFTNSCFAQIQPTAICCKMKKIAIFFDHDFNLLYSNSIILQINSSYFQEYISSEIPVSFSLIKKYLSINTKLTIIHGQAHSLNLAIMQLEKWW